MKERIRQSVVGFGMQHVFLLGAIALAMFALVSRLPAQDAAQDRRQALPVSVATVDMQNAYAITRYFAGRAATRRRGQLAFDLGGRIEAVFADDGDDFAKGEAIAQLDTDRLAARKARLEAQLAEAKANLALAERTLSRTRTLFEKGHVSNQRLDEAQAQMDAALARRETAEAGLAAVDVDLDKSVLRAPYDLSVERRLRDEGVVVEAGTPVLSVVERDAMEAQFGVPVEFARDLKAGVEFTIKTRDSTTIPAKLAAVSSAVRGQTRTVLVTMSLDGETARRLDITDGQTLDLAMKDTIDQRGAWLPITALTADVRGLWRVYRVTEAGQGDHVIETDNVQILYEEEDRVFVTGTIGDGDRIVSGGIERLVPGVSVTIVPPARTGAGQAS